MYTGLFQKFVISFFSQTFLPEYLLVVMETFHHLIPVRDLVGGTPATVIHSGVSANTVPESKIVSHATTIPENGFDGTFVKSSQRGAKSILLAKKLGGQEKGNDLHGVVVPENDIA